MCAFKKAAIDYYCIDFSLLSEFTFVIEFTGTSDVWNQTINRI